MELLVLDTNYVAVALVDAFSSLIWTDRFTEAGDFELYTSASSETFSIFQKGYYLYMKASEHMMIIDQVEITTDAESGSTLIIKGNSLEKLLDRRIVWNRTELSGNLQTAIKKLITDNIINPSDTSRKIDNFIFEDSEDAAVTKLTIGESGDVIEYDGETLYDAIQTLCAAYDIGFKVTLNSDNQFVFALYAGADRTYEQTDNPYVLFSPKFENIINSDYINTDADLKNVALVIGEENDNGSRRSTTVGTATGLLRRELYVDARDISATDDDGNAISASKYTNLLKQRGEETLLDYVEDTIVDGEVETTKLFKYNEDFFMGDLVQVENEFGISYISRITEMIYSQDESGYSNYPSFTIIRENSDSLQWATGHREVLNGQSSSVYTEFAPGLIAVVVGQAGKRSTYVYDMRVSDSQYKFTNTETVTQLKSFDTAANCIEDVTSVGFKLTDLGADTEFWYFALSATASQMTDHYAYGTFEGNSSGNTVIDCGFKPGYVCVTNAEADNVYVYNKDRSTTGYIRANRSVVAEHASFSTSSYCMKSIDDTGFTLTATSPNHGTYYWFAIGE